MRKLQVIGKRFNRLVVQSEQGKYLDCLCDCGEEKLILRVNVLAGYTSSCGCLNRERTSRSNTTHGDSRSALYRVWRQMHTRCYNKNHRAYPWYGAKGIEVCADWHKYENFKRDMELGYQEGLTLDRIDSNDDYYKENCRWLTKSQNSSSNI